MFTGLRAVAFVLSSHWRNPKAFVSSNACRDPFNTSVCATNHEECALLTSTRPPVRCSLPIPIPRPRSVQHAYQQAAHVLPTAGRQSTHCLGSPPATVSCLRLSMRIIARQKTHTYELTVTPMPLGKIVIAASVVPG